MLFMPKKSICLRKKTMLARWLKIYTIHSILQRYALALALIKKSIFLQHNAIIIDKQTMYK